MSWLSDKTGRPEEDGGHQRINISVDHYTRGVLDCLENKSNFVERCIRYFTQSKCIEFQELKESSNDTLVFKNGAVFEYNPVFKDNVVKQVNVSFNYLSAEDGIEFRLSVNNNEGINLVEKSPSKEYSYSHLYDKGELGFKPLEAMLRGKDTYVFRFQFRPLISFGRVYVKNIRMFIEVIDSPVIDGNLSNNNSAATNEKILNNNH